MNGYDFLLHRVSGALLAAGLLGLWNFCLPASAAHHPAWNLRVWRSDEGLPDNAVVGIGQTGDGFLWVATQGGLVRFDGLEFREVRAATAAGVPSGLMRLLCLDHENRLWVAKDRGVLLCLDSGPIAALTTRDEMPLIRPKTLVADRTGRIWMAFNGASVARCDHGHLRFFTQQDGLPGGDTCQLAVDSSGEIWLASAGTIGVIRNDRFLRLATVPDATCIAPARAGGVWICAAARLYRCREVSAPPVEVGQLPGCGAALVPTTAYEDTTGALWVGTSEEGLFRYDGTVGERVSTSHPEISCLAEDREGNLWVGTMGGGLNRLRPSVIELQETGLDQPLRGARSLCQDKAGVIWAADRNGRVLCNRGAGWQPLAAEQGWNIPNAASIAAEPDGGVWIGTQRNGLHLWRGRVVTSLTRSNGLAGNIVRTLLVTPANDLWIGTTAEALQRWRAGRLQNFELAPGSGSVRAMTVDRAGVVWIGTGNGFLLRVEGETLANETRTLPTWPQAIRCLDATADGSLWIGYGGSGLGRLKGRQFSQFSAPQGLTDDYLSQIVGDAQGRLWFAGNRGIFFARASEFDEMAAGRLERIRPVVFGRDDGLPALQASWDFWPGSLRAQDGRLYIAMQTAIAVINPDACAGPNLPPPVVIESVSVDEQEVAAYDPNQPARTGPGLPLNLRAPALRLRAPPGHQQVAFSFTAPSFISPRSESFRYRLEGLDKNWVEAGARRVAYYTHLPPGEYCFKVIACNQNGRWNETGASVALTAEPYLWQTTWFRGLAGVSGCGALTSAVFLFLRSRYRRKLELLQQREALERERARIARDLHDDLGAGLVEISFGSALAQNADLSHEEVREHAREIGGRAKELVTALDEIVWAVNPKHDNVASLASYFCQYAQHFLKATSVRCHLEVAKDLPARPLNTEQRHSLFLAFKEALSNVVRHAGASDLVLAISATGRLLSVAVRDNGRGIPADTQGEELGTDGLGNMERRLRQLGGGCRLTSKPGQGTTVLFEVPLAEPPSGTAS